MKNTNRARKIMISNALLVLFPVPKNWNPARTNSPILTPTVSSSDKIRPTKKRQRQIKLIYVRDQLYLNKLYQLAVKSIKA